jgi:hypothetical protein
MIDEMPDIFLVHGPSLFLVTKEIVSYHPFVLKFPVYIWITGPPSRCKIVPMPFSSSEKIALLYSNQDNKS